MRCYYTIAADRVHLEYAFRQIQPDSDNLLLHLPTPRRGPTTTAVSHSYAGAGTGSPAQLRYLVRRLRERAPTARIIVGLWPQGEAALSDAAIQRTLGADRYVGSLADAVTEIAEPAPDIAAAAA